jgi:hypothetical protein
MGAWVPRHWIAEPPCRSQCHALCIEQCWYRSSLYVRKLQTFSSGHSPAQVVIAERHPADMAGRAKAPILVTPQRAVTQERIGSLVVTNIRTIRLILLYHKARREVRWQHGHRCSERVSVRAMVMRTVAMELMTCRSGRIGGAAGSITLG